MKTSRALEEKVDQSVQLPSGSNRRDLLRNVAIGGLGIAGLTMLREEATSAAPAAEKITAVYNFTANFFNLRMNILNQTGNSFSGSFDDGTPFSGTVTGARPDFNIIVPITIVFNRTLSDGTLQTYIGAVATGRAGSDKNVMLAGVFYQNGGGPYPWYATGTVVG